MRSPKKLSSQVARRSSELDNGSFNLSTSCNPFSFPSPDCSCFYRLPLFGSLQSAFNVTSLSFDPLHGLIAIFNFLDIKQPQHGQMLLL